MKKAVIEKCGHSWLLSHAGMCMVMFLFAALPFSASAQVLAHAQSAPPPPGSGLPPPDINDPGVKPSSIPLPSSSIPPSEAPSLRAANGEQPPTVAVHTESNGDTVEEYRRGAALYMVRITPKNGGPTQTFMVNGGTGQLIRDPRMGPVSPVYYTIYQWGAPPKPAQNSGG
ncbi:MAG TPA: DUF2782 domain-containing protein [Rhodanobacteraceae bacterium]|nr:DUF2782 domain-containing protein [Rhodanobacteraceae bacterium]